MDSDVGGGRSKCPVSAMTVGGETSEVLEDDDVSIVSDDGWIKRSTQNGNVLPSFGVQAQSYYRKLSI